MQGCRLGGHEAYGASKLALNMWTYRLARLLAAQGASRPPLPACLFSQEQGRACAAVLRGSESGWEARCILHCAGLGSCAQPSSTPCQLHGGPHATTTLVPGECMEMGGAS